jgi:hypothetical protein
MFVQPVRSLSQPDIGWFVLDPVTRAAGLVDAADDRLLRELIKAHRARLAWVASTGGDERGAVSRIAAAHGADLVEDGEFELGRLSFRFLHLGGSPARFIQGPLSLYTGRLLEAGAVHDGEGGFDPRGEIRDLLNRLPHRTRIYPARGPVTTTWLERTFNSDFW